MIIWIPSLSPILKLFDSLFNLTCNLVFGTNKRGRKTYSSEAELGKMKFEDHKTLETLYENLKIPNEDESFCGTCGGTFGEKATSKENTHVPLPPAIRAGSVKNCGIIHVKTPVPTACQFCKNRFKTYVDSHKCKYCNKWHCPEHWLPEDHKCKGI